MSAAGAEATSASAVSWAAIIAGSVGAAAITLVLIVIGTGLGFASVSPFANSGVSGTTFTVMTAIWLVAVHAIAAGIGGYIAGRLRTKWIGVRHDEVYFRDTAHGFLSWAFGTILGALLLTSAVSSIIGAGAQAGATLASGATQGLSQGMTAGLAANAGGSSATSSVDPTSYFVDAMFRTDRPAPDANDQTVRTEVGRIVANAVRAGELPPADRTYVAQVIATRTGVQQAEAEKRIDQTIQSAKDAANRTTEQARQAAETARKTASYAALWMAAAMLIGAFCASIAATWGGRSRDD
ncbi:MAG: hypothetical protein K2X62_01005 [Beijerinckiaceae bacterium]|nr:hypothetical protein [Beijerinckiaceae bacterium]MDO9440177.1 hypothetical protein [Beijerinckiaceae bacterium]